MLLEFSPKEGRDFTNFIEDIACKRLIDTSHFDIIQHPIIIDSFKDEFLDYIGKFGLSSYLRRELLEEAVVKKGEAESQVLKLLHRFLAGVQITTELIIVDPYFFAQNKDPNYPTFVISALTPVLQNLKKLTIVTLSNKVDLGILSSLRVTISNTCNCQLFHRTSDDFHDRFWINPLNSKGFISGTSLNGLGKRYAVLDYLQSSDATEIIGILQQENLA